MPPKTDTFNPALDIPRLRELAAKNIFIGTSSWKYEGWLNQVYNEDYQRMLKGQPVLNKSKFDKECLTEYASVFPTVCNDGSYYRLPEMKQLEAIEAKLPEKFKMSFKCPENITLRETRSFDRSVPSQKNESYLDPNVFSKYVLKPIADVFKGKLGSIIFEFSPFFFEQGWGKASVDYDHEQFTGDLDKFLADLPKGYEFAVEIRDPILIHPAYNDYLNSLKKHGVSHVINAQTWMPPIEDQIKRAGIITTNRITIRALTRQGMKHEQAVKKYEPYTHTQAPMPEMRQTIAKLMTEAEHNQWVLESYINNRTEGNAPNTIHAILDLYDEMNGIEREEMQPISKRESFDLFG